MKPTIEIIPPDIDAAGTNLIGELSETGFTCLFQNDVDKKFTGLSFYQFDVDIQPGDIPAILKNIFFNQPLLNSAFHKVFISYSTPESVLMPGSLYKQELNSGLIDMVHGECTGCTIFADLIAEKNIYNAYRVSTDIHQFFNSHYPVIGFSHQYSLLLKMMPEESAILRLIVYREKFILMLSTGGELKIIQTYPYTSPQDIIYNLLNVCKQFEVEDPSLIISGMIEKHSGLYQEIAKYFRSVQSAEHSEVIRDERVPAHYFSHLYSMALCV